MKIKIPVARILHLLGTLIRVAPGGITKAEAEEIGRELTAIGLAILGQVVPGEIEIPV